MTMVGWYCEEGGVRYLRYLEFVVNNSGPLVLVECIHTILTSAS